MAYVLDKKIDYKKIVFGALVFGAQASVHSMQLVTRAVKSVATNSRLAGYNQVGRRLLNSQQNTGSQESWQEISREVDAAVSVIRAHNQAWDQAERLLGGSRNCPVSEETWLAGQELLLEKAEKHAQEVVKLISLVRSNVVERLHAEKPEPELAKMQKKEAPATIYDFR